jgi:hypothetical protein
MNNRRTGRRLMLVGAALGAIGMALAMSHVLWDGNGVGLFLAVGQVICGAVLAVSGFRQSRRPDPAE